MSLGAPWTRLGKLFSAEGQRPWMRTHAQMPHAEVLAGSTVRIYFTCRDEANRSHIGWLIVDLDRPRDVLELSAEPLMSPGPIGTFDDAGVMSSWMTEREGRRWFYLIGWNVKTLVPLHNSIGLAIGPASGPPRIEERVLGPILERNPINPFYVSCPCVLADGTGWRMWYLCGLSWELGGAKPASRYTVWSARSADGRAWTPDPEPCLRLEEPQELAIARPCVLRDPDRWRMWHCRRGRNFDYRIGYAESLDGERWTRLDGRLGLDPSGSGFDARMTCYPFVFDCLGERWMIYCGDGYGQGGLGLARAEPRGN